jgi:uncharacterized protein YbjT (DUF2867 family)
MSDFNGLVLVLGATGETGKLVVKSLQAKNIPVRVLVRDEGKASEFQSRGIEIIVGDPLNSHDEQRALTGVRAAISVLGTRSANNLDEIEAVENQAIANLIQAAKAVGVGHIVLCSSMGTTTPDQIPFLANILRGKRRGEIALIESGITYTIVHPGGLRNDEGGQGVLVKDTLQGFGTIARVDVAEVLVQALLQPDARNRSVDIINDPEQGPAHREGLFK